MLEHPEIGWIERTGYPSWLQPPAPPLIGGSRKSGKSQDALGSGISATAEQVER